jgi:hypothetical protein
MKKKFNLATFLIFGHQKPCLETTADLQNWFWLKNFLAV